ncbi:MAG: diadenylate cyclase CdaA [Candidatus Marinamargulisbacteria bacterium]
MINPDNLTLLNIIDVLFILVSIYLFFTVLKKTQIQNITAIVMIFIASYSFSLMIGLTYFSKFIEQFFILFLVFVMIIFQNEIRRASEKIRRGRLFFSSQRKKTKQPLLIKRILQSVEFMAKNKIGALMVIEQDSPLDEYTESGISINADLTSELVCSLFWPGSPTHDGAIIIRGNEILTAGCLLPLTSSKVSDKRLGTRHMSAIGISEETDALVIVVSEETGTISIAEKGNLTRFLNREALETRLFSLYKELTS